jgi:HD-like signal output (HDOD) protein
MNAFFGKTKATENRHGILMNINLLNFVLRRWKKPLRMILLIINHSKSFSIYGILNSK